MPNNTIWSDVTRTLYPERQRHFGSNGSNEARRLKELELENRRLKRAVAGEADKLLRERLLELAAERPRFGYRRLHVMLLREGSPYNP